MIKVHVRLTSIECIIMLKTLEYSRLRLLSSSSSSFSGSMSSACVIQSRYPFRSSSSCCFSRSFWKSPRAFAFSRSLENSLGSGTQFYISISKNCIETYFKIYKCHCNTQQKDQTKVHLFYITKICDPVCENLKLILISIFDMILKSNFTKCLLHFVR